MRILSTLAGLFLAFLLFMTGARFILLLLNANKGNEIVHWILSRSDYWLKPFVNLFHLTNKAVGDTGGVVEPASLIAFIVYAIVGSLILAALNGALFGSFGSWRVQHQT
jgi:uncharacterized membrane protein YdjX (TVP38/TMEM64 family)